MCGKWDVTATVIGMVTAPSAEEAQRGGQLRMTWHGEQIVNLPPRTAADE
ncbi:MAG: phosphoribosylformylglycinamidine synthase subunit PurL, partial [Actinomycetota bacterium]|nr:phosphoribosylformylglycinamidine synthase subunit PurL [Actinomycetota bacterium]